MEKDEGSNGAGIAINPSSECSDDDNANSALVHHYQHNILYFGDETLLHIVKFLQGADFNHEDLVSLAATCHKFDNLLQDRSLCEVIKFYWSLRTSRQALLSYLRQRSRSYLVTKFHVTDMYWIPSGVLRDAIVQMPNLTELLAAGTRLSWVHLKEILTTLNSVDSLSWSWDNRLEESIRKKGSISPLRFMELVDLKEKFCKLKNLLLHVPLATTVAPTDLIVCSFTSFVYLISLCRNLEQLWMMSWPKTSQERKFSSMFFQEVFDSDEIDLPHLKVLVLDVREPPRLHVPRLIVKLLQNLQRHSISPKVLWLDEPLINKPCLSMRRGITMEDRIWPDLDLSLTERLSIPLMEETVRVHTNIPHPFPTCKVLQISHGMPRIVNLNGKFDGASNLESFCCSAFNFKLDWRKVAMSYPNVKEANLAKTEGVTYPDYCAALAEMPSLQKISIPVEALIEIKDSRILREFSDCIPEQATPQSPTQSSVLGFKKRRVGIPTKPSPSGLTGLQLLTKRCSNVVEIEIGYSSKSCHAGRLLVNSLFYITQWKHLKKISLDGIPIKHGKFLIEIAKATSLESIRLCNLGPTGKCAYITDLTLAIRHCPHLKDLRLEQNYLGSVNQLLLALQNCPKLQRILLWSSPNDTQLDSETVLSLFDKCKNLVVFYAVIEPTLKIVCKKLRKALTDKYKTERPSLSIFIETNLEDDRIPTYPSVHFRQLVVNTSQVCHYNNFPTFDILR